jgi:hypothetical protein
MSKKLISFDKLKENPVYDEVLELNGTPKWIGPKEHAELGLDDSYYYQVRVVKDFYNLEDRGVLLLQVQFGELENIFNLYSTGESVNRRFLLMGRTVSFIMTITDRSCRGKMYSKRLKVPGSRSARSKARRSSSAANRTSFRFNRLSLKI